MIGIKDMSMGMYQDSPVLVYCVDSGELIGQYESINRAKSRLGLSSPFAVVDACNKNGKRKTTRSKITGGKVFLVSVKNEEY